MRSLLTVSPDDAAAVERAFASGADALVLDVASADGTAREAARRRACDILRAVQTDEERPLLYVRLSDLDDAAFDRDLAAVMPGEPDGILLARCRSGADVQQLGAKLAVGEAEHGLADGGTGIIAEAGATARGLLALASYGGAGARLVGLAWNAEALAADLGADVDDRAGFTPFDTARHLTLLAARAAEVAAIDAAGAATDEAALHAACLAARRHGFNARLAASLAEVAVINAVFGRD